MQNSSISDPKQILVLKNKAKQLFNSRKIRYNWLSVLCVFVRNYEQ